MTKQDGKVLFFCSMRKSTIFWWTKYLIYSKIFKLLFLVIDIVNLYRVYFFIHTSFLLTVREKILREKKIWEKHLALTSLSRDRFLARIQATSLAASVPLVDQLIHIGITGVPLHYVSFRLFVSQGNGRYLGGR